MKKCCWIDVRRRSFDLCHNDVIKCRHFPRYWPFARGIHRAQRPVARSFDVLFDLRLAKRLSKQSWGWWFETLWRPLWRDSMTMSHPSHQVYCGFRTSQIPTHWGRNKMAAILLTTFLKCILTRISSNLTPKAPIGNIYFRRKTMTWTITCTSLLTGICVDQPQWVTLEAMGRVNVGLEIQFSNISLVNMKGISTNKISLSCIP